MRSPLEPVAAVRMVLAVALALEALGCQDNALSDNAACAASGQTDAAVFAPDASTGDAGPCVAGSFTLLEIAGGCGDCTGFEDSVGLVVSASMAAEGGTLTDTEGNGWQFDPNACIATLSGSCNSLDAVNFATQTAACSVTCSNGGTPCPATCTLTRTQ